VERRELAADRDVSTGAAVMLDVAVEVAFANAAGEAWKVFRRDMMAVRDVTDPEGTRLTVCSCADASRVVALSKVRWRCKRELIGCADCASLPARTLEPREAEEGATGA